MDINRAAAAVEAFVRAYETAGATPVEVQVRPSGDVVDVIKVWVGLGASTVDTRAWAAACEAAIAKAVPAAARFTVTVRVEAVG